MADRLVAVDDSNYLLPEPVRDAYLGDIQNKLTAGVTNAVAAMPDVVTAVTAKVAALTSDTAVAGLVTAPSATRTALDARYRAGSATVEQFLPSATKDGAGNVTDWAPAFNAAFAAGFKNIELAGGGFYVTRTPIIVPSNSGVRIHAQSGLKATTIAAFLPAGNDNNAAIDVLGAEKGTGFNFGGFTLENVRIAGNDSICHGVHIQDATYVVFNNVLIESFKGAGLLLDVVMDSTIDVVIEDCGRTSGDYSSLADRSDNSKTLYSPLHLKSYRPGSDNCNMIRFTGQIEQNKVSPYVRIANSGIGLWFNNIHAEVRESADAGAFDFLQADGCEAQFTGMEVAGTFRNGFLLGPYGGYRFLGGRYLHNIRKLPGNGNGYLELSNTQAAYVEITSWGGQHKISNSRIDDLLIDYPGGGPTRISDSVFANATVTHVGAGTNAVFFDNCYGTSITAPITAGNVFVRQCDISGPVNIQAGGSRVENTSAGGFTLDGNVVTYIPRQGTGYSTSPPQFGIWNKSDKFWNSSPASGQPIGWVCTSGGTPGTWKAFGTIA